MLLIAGVVLMLRGGSVAAQSDGGKNPPAPAAEAAPFAASDDNGEADEWGAPSLPDDSTALLAPGLPTMPAAGESDAPDVDAAAASNAVRPRRLDPELVLAHRFRPYSEPALADDRDTTAPLVSLQPLPGGESDAPVVMMQKDDFAALMEHLTGQSEMPVWHRQELLGGQYLRVEWVGTEELSAADFEQDGRAVETESMLADPAYDETDDAESPASGAPPMVTSTDADDADGVAAAARTLTAHLARVTTTLSAGPDERAAMAIPVAPLRDGPVPITRRGQELIGLIRIRVGSYSGLRYAPASDPFWSASWARRYVRPTIADEQGREPILFDVPVGPRAYTILDIARPPEVGGDWELGLVRGAGSYSIFKVAAAAGGADSDATASPIARESRLADTVRLFFFSTIETPYSQVLHFAWVPPGAAAPPEEPITATVSTVYRLAGQVTQFSSRRHYRAPEGEPFSRLGLFVSEDVGIDNVRSDVPAIWEQPRADYIRVRFARPVEEATLEVIGRQPLPTMQERSALYAVTDTARCLDERIAIEAPPSMSLLESGFWGLKPDPDPVDRPTIRSNAFLRTFRTKTIRTGDWSFQFFRALDPGVQFLSQRSRIHYFDDGIGATERITYALGSGKPEEFFPQPLVIELPRGIDRDSLEVRRLDGEPPTTKELRIAPASRDDEREVWRLELGWEGTVPRAVDLTIGYKIIGFETLPDVPEQVPMCVVPSAEARSHTLEIYAEGGLHLVSVGEFLLEPQRPLPIASRLEPEPARRFVLTSAFVDRSGRPVVTPTVLRDATPYVETWE
jgi:hypothetical protein